MLDFSIRREIASAKSVRILAAIFAATVTTIALSGLFVGYVIMALVVAFADIQRWAPVKSHRAVNTIPDATSNGVPVSILGQYTDAYSAWEILLHTSIVSGILVGLFVLTKIVYQWISIHRGGGWALGLAVGGRPIDIPSTPQERQLVNIVEEIAIAFASAPPAIVLLDQELGINAFAAGLSDDDQIVCVTAGAIHSLNRDELQGMIAHEMSHLASGDTALGTMATAVIYGLRSIHEVAATMVRYGWEETQASFHGSDRSSRHGGAILMIPVGMALWPVGFTGAALAHGLSILMNQQREYLADATAVARTRHPESLASALRKIADHPGRGTIRHRQSFLVAAMWFVSASGNDGRLSTHPPLRNRIIALDPTCEKAALIDSAAGEEAIERMEHSFCTLLSLLSNCDGDNSLSDYEFMRGWSRVSSRQRERRSLEDMTPDEVEFALEILRDCSSHHKEAFLEAAEQVITADQVGSPQETELLEKLHAALGR